MTKTKRMTKAILETLKDMAESGILDKKSYKKTTMRHMDKNDVPKIDPITPEEIRASRVSRS